MVMKRTRIKTVSVKDRVQAIATKMGVTLQEAMIEYNRIQRARAISSEASMQEYALGVSKHINNFKLKRV